MPSYREDHPRAYSEAALESEEQLLNLIRVLNQKKELRPAGVYAMKARNDREELNVVKLDNALLCANCEMIVGETRNGRCPVCGSGAQLSLARLLGGTTLPAHELVPSSKLLLVNQIEARAS